MTGPDSNHIFLTDGTVSVSYGELYSIFEKWSLQPELEAIVAHKKKSPKNELQTNSSIDCKHANIVGLVAGKNVVNPLLLAFFWLKKIPVMMLPEKATTHEYQHFISSVAPALLVLPAVEHPIIELVQKNYPGIRLLDSRKMLSFLKNPVNKPHNAQPDMFSEISLNFSIQTVKRQDRPHQTHATDPSEVFGYFFTSGSSGNPKCVPIKRRQIISSWSAFNSNIKLERGDLWLHTLPLNHIGGASIITRSILSGSGLFLPKETDAASIADILAKQKTVVGLSVVPTQLKRILDLGNIAVSDKFKAVLLGGGPADPELIRSALKAELPVIPSFGMTETAAQCLAVPFSEWRTAPAGTCGKPLLGVEARLAPFQNDEDSLNEQAQLLWLRGPQIFDGYKAQQQSGPEFDSNGWFCTGDYARIDTNGYYFIEMRRSDRIVTGGENVNPAEIEHVIRESNILDVDFAVFAIKNHEWGQIVALAVTNPKTSVQITPELLKKHLASKISTYKIPKRVFCVDNIPRTETGKIKRFELSARFDRD
jgi:o-succinylbenzoate---CoA ligase